MTTQPTINDNARTVDIIGYDCGWGCGNYGCEDGPGQLPADQILAILQHAGFLPQWQGPLGIKNLGQRRPDSVKTDTLPLLQEGLDRLSRAVAASAARQHIPLVFGGDHSSAIGTWSGIVSAQQQHGKFGLIWIDAHMDCHTFETSHQGKWGGWWHGQPVAALTGQGLPQFTQLGDGRAKISPEHIAIIGAHSFEPAEVEFTKNHNLRVYTLDEVKSRGFATVWQEALQRVTTGTQGWGMTIDLDAFHPDEAPGVGTDESDGLCSADVLPLLKSIAHMTGFSGLEIAEFNPHRDRNFKTVNLIEKLVESIFTAQGSMGHTRI